MFMSTSETTQTVEDQPYSRDISTPIKNSHKPTAGNTLPPTFNERLSAHAKNNKFNLRSSLQIRSNSSELLSHINGHAGQENLSKSIFAGSRGRNDVVFKDMKKGILIRKQDSKLSRAYSIDKSPSPDPESSKSNSQEPKDKNFITKIATSVGKLRSSFSFFGRKKTPVEDTPQPSEEDRYREDSKDREEREDSQDPRRKKNVTFANKIDDATPKNLRLQFTGFPSCPAPSKKKKLTIIGKPKHEKVMLDLENSEDEENKEVTMTAREISEALLSKNQPEAIFKPPTKTPKHEVRHSWCGNNNINLGPINNDKLLFSHNEPPKGLSYNGSNGRHLKPLPLPKDNTFMKIAPISKTPSFSALPTKAIPTAISAFAQASKDLNNNLQVPLRIPLEEGASPRRASMFTGTTTPKLNFKKTSSFHHGRKPHPDEPEPFTPVENVDGDWTMRLNKMKHEQQQSLSPKQRLKTILDKKKEGAVAKEEEMEKEEEPKMFGAELFNKPSKLQIRKFLLDHVGKSQA